jgi:hypothetical protein
VSGSKYVPQDREHNSNLQDSLGRDLAAGRGRMSLAFSSLVDLKGNREIECVANSCGNGPKKAVSGHFSLLSKQVLIEWRRGWDSNPRDPFGSNGFQDRRLQPLGHPSEIDLIIVTYSPI